MSKFNAIVIGLGLIGMKFGFDLKRKQPASHISVILENPSLRLIGVCDADENARELFREKYGDKIDVFEDYSELVRNIVEKKLQVDLVVIATPDSTHYNILNYLIKILSHTTKPVIIFCEKPLTSDLISAKKIQQMQQNYNLKIIVNHSRRWSKIWREVYDLTKEIGNVENASFYFSTSPENKNIIQIRDGIHIADLINWFGIADKTNINRLLVSYFIYDFHLWGSKGKIEVLSNGEILNFFKMKESQRYEGFQELELLYTKNLQESMLSNAYAEFVDFLDGKIPSLSTNIDDAVTALEVFEKYVYDASISER